MRNETKGTKRSWELGKIMGVTYGGNEDDMVREMEEVVCHFCFKSSVLLVKLTFQMFAFAGNGPKEACLKEVQEGQGGRRN